MKTKRFFIGAVTVVAACLLGLLLLVVLVDPLFAVNGVEDGETALFTNQRYEMPGLIRNQDYSVVVMGTSLAANFRASWFEEGLGKDTLKITFPDGWISEFDRALGLAYETHPGLEQVFFCLDPNILVRPDSQRTVTLPDCLYNTTLLDDVEFYLNADAVILAGESLVAYAKGEGTDLDGAYIWDDTEVFSEEQALFSYHRPEVRGSTLPEDAFRAACDENLAVITRWIEDHPDTQFTIWFPPYSILYWDKMDREGKTDAMFWAVEYAAQRLLEYENVNVHCFMMATLQITDLEDYTDHIHCSADVTRWMAEEMLAGRWQFNKENYQLRLDELRDFVANYDYERLFAGKG